ncbi:YcdB/YcdC domain-containing protein [Priestia abyssalis]|uniref:YcdB/YcdC domain-containing protein n=1 Tax=Priestia abyssalis TaxID=1221450 RepID=UPI0014745407|nr:YcdB/YcdC domain-containing protein [Priestia abyssalis]
MDKWIEKANRITVIPDHYKLVVQELSENEERKFVHLLWENEQNADETISFTFNEDTGEVNHFATDYRDDSNAGVDMDECMQQFIKQAAPSLLSKSLMKIVEPHAAGREEVSYCQHSGGVMIPFTGCYFFFEDGQMESFSYYELIDEPVMPAHIVPKEQVLNKVKHEQKMDFVYTHDEQGCRLMYDPNPSTAFIVAETGENLHDESHYELPPSSPIERVEARGELETFLQLQEDQYDKTVLKEEDGELTIGYLPKGWVVPQEKEGSYKAYFESRFSKLHYLKNGAICTYDQSSGQLLQFFSGRTSTGAYDLTDEECFERALQFLSAAFPNYERYMRVWKKEDDEQEEKEEKAFFHFSAYVNGIRLNLEMVMVNVNRTTGLIEHYASFPYKIIEAAENFSPQPVISEQEALDIYLRDIDVKLKWHKREDDGYCLVYQPAFSKGDIYGIDAMTGEIEH